MVNPSGVYLPVVTPFRDNAVDYESYVNLLTHYKKKGISGFIPLGTTGESPCITDDEYKRIIHTTLETVDGQLPVFAGIGGNFTDNVLKRIREYENTGIVGILSVCPYYNRPGQDGLFQHFERISESTDLDIIIYNIPYRTGVNMSNDTLLKLSECGNIVGVKDSCGDIRQSLDLISRKPDGFAVLTGEDHLFYTTVANGGDGGILAAAHLYTDEFIDVYKCLENNDHKKALGIWNSVKGIIPQLFEEPNPGPIKHCLSALELIRSSETRPPLGDISIRLQKRLDVYLKNDRSKMGGW
jgi:4-hydroxy-tetrahydrodipicolinate synthase